MRECSGISDVIDYWSHFIVTMMATLAQTTWHMMHLFMRVKFSDIKRALITDH
jgi:hypothetical protein